MRPHSKAACRPSCVPRCLLHVSGHMAVHLHQIQHVSRSVEPGRRDETGEDMTVVILGESYDSASLQDDLAELLLSHLTHHCRTTWTQQPDMKDCTPFNPSLLLVCTLVSLHPVLLLVGYLPHLSKPMSRGSERVLQLEDLDLH